MNKNLTPIILLILAIGIYFTFTKAKIEEIKSVRTVNAGYEKALENSEKLIKVRDQVLKTYKQIDPKSIERLQKIVQDNIDNVRLIIDMKNIGLQQGLILKNIKTSASNSLTPPQGSSNAINTNSNSDLYNTMTLSFDVTASYESFIQLLKTIESSLRILDVTKINISANDGSIYDYKVELKTYWLK